MTGPVRFDPDLLRRMERLAVVARRAFRGTGQGERRARMHGASTEFRDHRSYAPGDDLRHLDWNLYARLDRLHLKRFHDEQEVRLHLAIDTSASMDHGQPRKFDTAAHLTAALGWMALTGRDLVVLHPLGESDAPPPPLAGRSSARRLLDWLSRLEPRGAVDVAEGLRDVGRRARRPGIVVAISDFLSEGAARGVEALAAAGHQVHAVQVLSPQERAPDLAGDLTLVDCETGREVSVTMSGRLARIYREGLADLEAELVAAARRCGATVTATTSDESLEELLFTRLRRQGVLA